MTLTVRVRRHLHPTIRSYPQGVAVRAEIHLIDANGLEVATHRGDPHYMPADWQERAIALIQELRVATAEIQGLAAAPPALPE